MSEKVYRPTLSELWRAVQDASRRFPVGTEWQHYGGETYEVSGHGIDEETGKAEVRYIRARALADDRAKLRCAVGDFPIDFAREIEFHRNVDVFGGTVDGSTRRFTRVRRCEHYERV
jgi:hypothetical protein